MNLNKIVIKYKNQNEAAVRTEIKWRRYKNRNEMTVV